MLKKISNPTRTIDYDSQIQSYREHQKIRQRLLRKNQLDPKKEIEKQKNLRLSYDKLNLNSSRVLNKSLESYDYLKFRKGNPFRNTLNTSS